MVLLVEHKKDFEVRKMNKLILIGIFICIGCVVGQEQTTTTEIIDSASTPRPSPKIVLMVFICEMEMLEDLNEWITTFFNEQKNNYPDVEFSKIIFPINRWELQNLKQKLCKIVSNGLSIMIDVTFTGWKFFKTLASERDIPYIQMRITNFEFVYSTLEYITAKYGKDLAMVFQNERGMHYMDLLKKTF